MGNTLETLRILIEADATGLNSQLSKAGKNIQSFVSSMNSQTVDWTQILSSTISPAIISGIASSFAIAILSATQFQNAMTNVGNNTSDTMGQSSAAVTGAVTDLASTTGQTLADTGSAYQAFNRLLNNSADAQATVTAASSLAFAAHMSLGDVVNMLIPLFQNWNITTGTDAVSAITGLANAASKGQFTLSQLVDTVSKGGQVLSSSTDITTTALQLQDLSTKSGESIPKIQAMFDTIIQNANNAQSPLTLIVGGISNIQKVIESGGIMGAIKLFGDKIGGLGPIASASMGISTTTFKAFATTTDAIAATVEADVEKMKTSLTSLQQLEKDSTTQLTEFQKAWNKFTDLLGTKIGIPVLDTLTKLLSGNISGLVANAGDMAKTIGSGGNNSLIQPSPMMSLLGDALTGLSKIIGNKDTTSTPAGTNNVYNYNTSITSGAVGNGQGPASVTTSLYNQVQGYPGK